MANTIPVISDRTHPPHHQVWPKPYTTSQSPQTTCVSLFVFLLETNLSPLEVGLFLRIPVLYVTWICSIKSGISFLSFFAQVSRLIQFFIENAGEIFGEQIFDIFGEVSGMCSGKENIPGIVNNRMCLEVYKPLTESVLGFTIKISNIIHELGETSQVSNPSGGWV